jgi:tetratricopeptide (TPR) repeat protein
VISLHRPRLNIVWTAPRRRLDPLLVKVGVGCIIVSITGGGLTVSGIAIASPTAGAGEVALGLVGVLLLVVSPFCTVEGQQTGGDGHGERADASRGAVEAARLTTLPVQGPCFGRDAIIEELVATVLAKPPSPIPVLGPPGVGKTTVTVALLHDRRVERRYGSRRYFVRCEGAPDAEALLTEIAGAVGVAIGADLKPRVMAAFAAAPALVVLDNVETPWLPDTLATEQLLLTLISVPCLALVASLRGVQRPGGGVWRPGVHILPLSEDNTRRIFLDVAGKAYEDDPDLSELVAALDGLPLAVELLAHAAEGEPNLAALRRRWVDERVALLSRGAGDDRLLSLAVSLELSITGSSMTDEARRLLALLGVLPDGISHQDLTSILPGAAERGASVLRKVGLAFDERQRLRSLAPIRDHVSRTHRPTEEDLTRAMAHYIGQAQNLGPRVGWEGGAVAAVRLAAESANLEAMALEGLSGEDPRASIDAALALTEFWRYTGIGSTRVPAAACAVARRLGDASLHARCSWSLGHIALRRSDNQGAKAHYEEALLFFSQVGDLSGQADCIHGLGDISLRRSDHEGARARYEEALSLYRQVGSVLGEANCIRRLGNIAVRRSDHEGARARYEEALELYRQVGDVLGEATCIRKLGEMAVRRSDHEEARARFEEALPLFRRVGSILGEVYCMKGMGDMARDRSDHEGAKAHYEEALPLFRQIGDVLPEADCIERLGDMAMDRFDHEQARARYEEALRLFLRLEDPYSIGVMHRRLARIATSAAERSRHWHAAEEAWTGIGRDDLIRELCEEFRGTG